MKNKFIVAILVLGICTSFIACGKKDNVVEKETESATEQETEVTTEYNTESNTESDTESNTESNTENDTESTSDYGYSACTSKSVQEVEDFAKQITVYFQNEDWKSLADNTYFPNTINNKYYDSKEKFLNTDWSKEFSEEFKKSVADAKTTELFCNWQGIMMADGEIWINEIDNKLMVSTINFYDGSNKADASSGIVGHWVLDMAKTEENLKNYGSLQEIFGTGIHVGATLDINADNTFELELALADAWKGTYNQDENMINVQYKDLTGENVEAVFSYEMIDDELYIISEYADEQMYWTKLAE